MSKKLEPIKKFYTFSQEELTKLQNIEIGTINAEATLDGLNIYRNAILGSVYKRLGIDGEPKEGFSKGIRYNLKANKIEYTQTPNNTDNPDMKVKSPQEKRIARRKDRPQSKAGIILSTLCFQRVFC
jgi:hypothetical protein